MEALIGKRVEITTNEGNRYTGLVYSIDLYNFSLCLAKLKLIGSLDYYDVMIFKGTSISHIHFPDDPAIVYRGRVLNTN